MNTFAFENFYPRTYIIIPVANYATGRSAAFRFHV